MVQCFDEKAKKIRMNAGKTWNKTGNTRNFRRFRNLRAERTHSVRLTLLQARARFEASGRAGGPFHFATGGLITLGSDACPPN